MIRVRFTLDYGEHYAAMLKQAEEADRAALVAYGTIVEEQPPTDGAVKVFVVEYDGDGWDARGLVEDTETEIGLHASFERIG